MKTLQEFLEIDPSKELLDVKLSLGKTTIAPSEIEDQLRSIIKDDEDGKLNDFIDY